MADFQQNQPRDRDFNQRPRHNRNFRNDRGYQQHGRGRQQRPLLTSSINAAGFGLVSLILAKQSQVAEGLLLILALTTVSFALSSIVSYVAQRARGAWIERISDLLFLLGAAGFVWVTLTLSGLVAA